MTSDLVKRIHEDRNDLVEGFSNEYGVDNLVYFEATDSIESALLREKQLKKWNRAWKIHLIEKPIPVGETCIQSWSELLDAR